jgi:hypothetical protein
LRADIVRQGALAASHHEQGATVGLEVQPGSVHKDEFSLKSSIPSTVVMPPNERHALRR